MKPAIVKAHRGVGGRLDRLEHRFQASRSPSLQAFLGNRTIATAQRNDDRVNIPAPAPGETALGETAPGETALGEMAPGEMALGEMALGEMAPGETAPCPAGFATGREG